MNSKRLVALALAFLFIAPVFARQSEQTPASFPNELAVVARKKALMNDSKDLEAVAKSVQNQASLESSVALQLVGKASSSIEELDAALWFLAVYDHMQCEPDRDMAKQALVNRLGLYAHLLELRADQELAMLPSRNYQRRFKRVPDLKMICVARKLRWTILLRR